MRTLVPMILAVPLALAACGDDGSGGAVDAAAVDAPDLHDGTAVDAAVDAPFDGPAAALRLTSTAFVEGGAIPSMYTCRGANVSPPLAWTGGPAAPGYALVLTDLDNNLVHSIIWDIPGATTGLPENVAKVAEPPVPAGAKQALAYDNQTRGYLGPCPPSQHTYQFALHAVDVRPLPAVALNSPRAALLPVILAHDIATGLLTATFAP